MSVELPVDCADKPSCFVTSMMLPWAPGQVVCNNNTQIFVSIKIDMIGRGGVEFLKVALHDICFLDIHEDMQLTSS